MVEMLNDIYDWGHEFVDLNLGDKRLCDRLGKIMDALAASPGESIFLASGCRSSAKATYRFLNNENVSVDELLSSIATATGDKIACMDEDTILCIQDTTGLGFGGRKKIEGMGYYCNEELHGMNVHTCIAVSEDGLPLGLLHQQYQTREKIKNVELTQEEKRCRSIEEKENYCWLQTLQAVESYLPEGKRSIHICDREGDFYELFDFAEQKEQNFLIRIVQNRMTSDGKKLMDELKKEPFKGSMYVHVARNPKTSTPDRNVLMKYTYKEMKIKRPARRKEGHLSESLEVTGIYVYESGVPDGKGLHWFLMTNMQIRNPKDVEERIKNYIQRWKIERFHFVLKSGCHMEEKQARSYEKLTELTLLYSVIAMKIMNFTYFGRLFPNIPCDLFLTEDEWKLLYCLGNKTNKPPEFAYPLCKAVHYIAKLGGYKGAPSDPKPGLKVLWLGLEKLIFVMEYRSYIF